MAEVGGLIEPRDAQQLIREKSTFLQLSLSNGAATERLDFLQRLQRYKAVDCGGGLMNNIGALVPQDQTIAFRRPYKFTIAFENASHPGYTTEKIMMPFSPARCPSIGAIRRLVRFQYAGVRQLPRIR